MRLVPGLNGQAGEGNDRGDQQKLHAPIANDARQGEQRKRQYGTEKKPPQSCQLGPFFPCQSSKRTSFQIP